MKAFLKRSKQQLNLVKNVVLDSKKFLDKVKYGNTDIPFSMREMLQQIVDEPITSILIIRNPVSTTLIRAMDALSGFTLLKKLKESPYDSLFHLKIRINDKYDYEKEQVVKLNRKNNVSNQEDLNIPTTGLTNCTIRQFVQNHINSMGMKSYVSYDGRNNNCQVFVVIALHANGIVNEVYDNWIKQDTEFVFRNNPNPLFHHIMNKITDIGNRAVLLQEGGALDVSKTTTVTNFEIIALCKALKLPLRGVYMKDEINLRNLKDGNYIMNLQNHDEDGSYWVGFVKKGKTIYYSDSFGMPPPQNEVNLFKKDKLNLYYNKIVLQDLDSCMCGFFAVALLLVMTKSKGPMKERMENYVRLFDLKKPKNNNQRLHNLFSHLLKRNIKE